MEKDFPFTEDPDTDVFTCCHVLSGERPVLYVSHDEDGCWQFLCGGEHNTEDGRIISLYQAYLLDNSVKESADMQCGCYAERVSPGSKWKIIEDT